MVIADSNIWIEYLRNPNTDVGLAFQSLLESNQILLTGVVFAEVLQGARNRPNYNSIFSRLNELPFQEMTKVTWSLAGRIGFRLRREGRLIPMTDLAIAASALEGDHEVYSLDEHFDRIQELKRYFPTTQAAK